MHLTGSLAQAVDSQKSNSSARNNTQGYTLIFIVVLLLVVYRAILAPIITLIPAALSLLAAGPVIAESTKLGVQVSPITELLLIVLLLGAGTDYGLFLVFRVREEIRRGLVPKEAVVQALSRVGEAITFSALTVGAALLSLLLATFGFYKGLGPALAIGLGVLLLASLTLLPALLAIFGRAAFWPTRPKAGESKIGFWGRVADRVIERPVVTLVVGTLLLGGLALGIVGYKTTGFGGSGAPSGSDSAKGAAEITAHYPAANSNPEILLVRYDSSVWSHFDDVALTQKALSQAPDFKAVSGPLNPGGFVLDPTVVAGLYQKLGPPGRLPPNPPVGSKISAPLYRLYQSLGLFVSPDGRTVQYYALLRAGETGSTEASRAMPAVRATLSAVQRQVGAETSGVYSQDAFVYDINQIATSDLKRIVPVVLAIIAILLAILLRSLVAPWYLIATVGLSYLATLGFAMIVFVHFGNHDGLNFFLPFLLFVFSMALGEDYNILVMSRIREEAQRDPEMRAAITKAIGVTGSTVTSAGLILAGTFTVLGLVGGDPQIQQIGFSVAFGILLDTFFVRTLFVPSIAVLLGRRNWWPSKLSRVPATVE